jgi:hypothetical protein
MSGTLLKYVIASLAAILFGCSAAVPPGTTTATSGVDGRSCGLVVVAHADTAVDSKDPLLRMMQPMRGRLTPIYPADMKALGVSGRVVASFIVDTLGRVPRGGVWIQQETRPSFGDAVCAHLSRVQFAPLVVNGRLMSVRVLNWWTSFDISG